MLTAKNKYDHMIIAICKAILTVYETIDEVGQGAPVAPPQKSAPGRFRSNSGRCNLVPTDDGNGLKCSLHGTKAEPSKKDPGQYYCKTGFIEYKESLKNR
jgi:hypothetical protein